MGILALGHVGRRTFVFWKYTWIAFFIFNSDILRCYSVNIPRKPVDSLYDVSDIGKLGLSIFDNTTLKEAIYSSDQAWFVQFYSSWCGHCVNFAPTWKIFANDVKGWWRVARIAVLNCADPYNTKICSEYVDVGFPSLRLFKAFQQNGTGDLCKAPRDVSHLRQALIDHISKHSPQNTPSNWPMLSPVKVKWLLNFFWRNPRTKMKFIAVVFEDSESYTGRELILDMSNLKNILVVRVLQQELSRNPLPSEWKVGELPSLFILRQNGKPSKLWRMGNRESFFKALQAYIKQTLPASGTKETLNGQEQERNVMNGPDDNLRKIPHHEVDKNIEQFVNHTSRRAVARLVVYMEDLESTLIYSLRYEVALQKLIKADAMSALQAYIAVLNKYFPGRPCVMSTLNKLQKLLQPRVYLSNDGWSSILNQLHNFQNPDCFFKNDVTWVGCKGSAAIYRGYPCGLWVLFHTLTVSHASQDSYHPIPDSKEVLRAMKGYIHFFFSCRVCSDNFAKESIRLESSVRTLEGSILWLWQVHNHVNKRLAGDLAEDPQHPKVAFPSYPDCKTCRNANRPNEWNKTRVLHFMKELYGVTNINFTMTGVKPILDDRISTASSKHVKVGTKVTFGYLSLGFDTRDISICLSLYALCTALLLLICIYIRHRQKRKLFKYLI